MAIAAGLYLTLFALAAAIDGSGLTHHPHRHFALFFSFIGLLMSLCSLGAIWWATSQWSSYAKTLPVMLAGLVCWLGLSLVTGWHDTARTGAWAIAFELHVVVAATLASMAVHYLTTTGARAQQQFTILWLLLWTAVLAVILGVGRVLTALFGWTAAVFAWEFFWHVQIFAITNGLLAAALFAAVIANLAPWKRIGAILLATVVAATTTPAVLSLMFKNLGSGIAELVLLFTAHALFLLAALVPLRNLWLTGEPAITAGKPT